MESVIVIGLIILFVANIPASIRKSRYALEQEDRQRRIDAQEDTYFSDLVTRADSGEKEAADKLVWFGYKRQNHWSK